jgi:predicted phosphodiesterase
MIIKQIDTSDDVSIYPISDIHFGSVEHNSKEWTKFANHIGSKPNAYIILGGDLINNATRSSVSNIFEERMRPRDQKIAMARCLEPIKDKIICAVSGNHERRSIKDADDDPMYDIMCQLGLEDIYRPNAAYVKVSIGSRRTEDKPEVSYTFCVTHGAGGGIFTGAAVNRNERYGNIIDGLDCLIVGHTHKGTMTKPSKIVIDAKNNVVSIKQMVVVSCVSWLEYGGYAAQKMLLPASTASADQPQIIQLAAQRNHKQIKLIW